MLATAAITEKIASELQTAGRPLSLSELSDTTKGDRAALKEKLDDLVDTGHMYVCYDQCAEPFRAVGMNCWQTGETGRSL